MANEHDGAAVRGPCDLGGHTPDLDRVGYGLRRADDRDVWFGVCVCCPIPVYSVQRWGARRPDMCVVWEPFDGSGYTHTDEGGVHYVTVRCYADLGDTVGAPRVYSSEMLADPAYVPADMDDLMRRSYARSLLAEARERRCGPYSWHHADCAAARNPSSLCSVISRPGTGQESETTAAAGQPAGAGGGQISGLAGSGETTSLNAALAYTTAMAGNAQQGVTSVQTSISGLTAGGVTGPAIAALHAAREALAGAAAAFQNAHTALVRHIRVQEQYAANPDAGTKQFVTAD